MNEDAEIMENADSLDPVAAISDARNTDNKLDVNGKKAFYDTANKEVAIMCNHQKGVNKSHDAQMGKIHEKVKDVEVRCRSRPDVSKMESRGTRSRTRPHLHTAQ